jgi:hypothetical protein
MCRNARENAQSIAPDLVTASQIQRAPQCGQRIEKHAKAKEVAKATTPIRTRHKASVIAFPSRSVTPATSEKALNMDPHPKTNTFQLWPVFTITKWSNIITLMKVILGAPKTAYQKQVSASRCRNRQNSTVSFPASDTGK